MRAEWASALGRILSVVPILIEVLELRAPNPRFWVTVALDKICVGRDPVLPALIDTLNDDDKSVRAGTASAVRLILISNLRALTAE